MEKVHGVVDQVHAASGEIYGQDYIGEGVSKLLILAVGFKTSGQQRRCPTSRRRWRWLTGVGRPWRSGAPNSMGEEAKRRGDDTKLT
jgi:hypothetical protein